MRIFLCGDAYSAADKLPVPDQNPSQSFTIPRLNHQLSTRDRSPVHLRFLPTSSGFAKCSRARQKSQNAELIIRWSLVRVQPAPLAKLPIRAASQFLGYRYLSF